MSYKIIKTIVSMVAGIVLIAAYFIFTMAKVRVDAVSLDNVQFWARSILIFISIGVVATIVIQIVFHILLAIAMAVKEQVKTGQCDDQNIEKKIELEMVEDEMDKLIELKAMRISYVVVGAGFVSALLFLALNYPVAVMLNIVFASFFLGSLIEGCTQIYYYRKGIRNG